MHWLLTITGRICIDQSIRDRYLKHSRAAETLTTPICVTKPRSQPRCEGFEKPHETRLGARHECELDVAEGTKTADEPVPKKSCNAARSDPLEMDSANRVGLCIPVDLMKRASECEQQKEITRVQSAEESNQGIDYSYLSVWWRVQQFVESAAAALFIRGGRGGEIWRRRNGRGRRLGQTGDRWDAEIEWSWVGK